MTIANGHGPTSQGEWKATMNGNDSKLSVGDVLAASSGSAIGSVAAAALGLVLAAPVTVPIAGALVGGAVGVGIHRLVTRHN